MADITTPTPTSLQIPIESTTTTMEVRCTISPYDLTTADDYGAVVSYGKSCPAYANVVHVLAAASNSTHANYVVTDKDRDGVHGLNDTQWRTLMSLLNAGSSTLDVDKLSAKSSWILDTGASHHLTGNYSLLSDVRSMEPVLVVLADGREKVSIVEGSVVLGTNLVLKSVYYVEGFTSDLIAVGQLMDENKCVVQLADQFLVIQDRVSRMLIGAGKRDGGTYSFRRMESVAAVTTTKDTNYELWHHRLGHPSMKIVGSLKDLSFSDFSEYSNKACDVCLRAKQTRSTFPISSNKTSRIFELIHCDLWGPYRIASHSGARYFFNDC